MQKKSTFKPVRLPARESSLLAKTFGVRSSLGKGGFFTPRALITLLLCGAACLIVTRSLLAFFHSEASSKLSQRTLRFQERVAYQRAIEEVYWRQRIWPE